MQKKSDDIEKRVLRKDKPEDQWALHTGQSNYKRPEAPKEKTSDNTTKPSTLAKNTKAKRELAFLPKRKLVHTPVKESNIFSKVENIQKTTEKQKEKTSGRQVNILSAAKGSTAQGVSKEQIVVRHKLLRTPPPKPDILSSKKKR